MSDSPSTEPVPEQPVPQPEQPKKIDLKAILRPLSPSELEAP